MLGSLRPIGLRQFVLPTLLLGAAIGLCACASSDRSADPTGVVDAGPLSLYARDGIVDRFAKSNNFMLVTYGGRLTALSATCTKDHATLNRAAGTDGFVCPRDNSRFDRTGQAREGSAAREPLVHYVLSVNAAGHVMVDTGKPLTQPHWARTDAYLTAR